MAPRGNLSAIRANREQADLENQGIDLSLAQMEAVESFAASARAVTVAIAMLERALPALKQAQAMCQRGAVRADEAHRAAVALTSKVSRLEKVA